MTTTLLTASSVACELPCKEMGNISLTLELDLTKWGKKKVLLFMCSAHKARSSTQSCRLQLSFGSYEQASDLTPLQDCENSETHTDGL